MYCTNDHLLVYTFQSYLQVTILSDFSAPRCYDLHALSTGANSSSLALKCLFGQVGRVLDAELATTQQR
jgi:hypothetical protein